MERLSERIFTVIRHLRTDNSQVGADGNSRYRVKVCQHRKGFPFFGMKKSGTAEDSIERMLSSLYDTGDEGFFVIDRRLIQEANAWKRTI